MEDSQSSMMMKSAFQSKKKKQESFSYVENGYKIIYNKLGKYIAGNLKIENENGWVLFLEPVSVKDKILSKIVNIIENDCEVVNKELSECSRRVMLTNFCGYRSLSRAEKNQLLTDLKEFT